MNLNTISPESLLAQLKWRYATKKFDAAKKIAAKVWSALEEALVLTPSSFGLQPWKFIVITSASSSADHTFGAIFLDGSNFFVA